jgi:hypothetical protein
MRAVNLRSTVVKPVASGALLYLFAWAWKIFAALVLPVLAALHQHAPKLAALGWLALLLSPALFVGGLHGATHGVLDWFDSSRARPGSRALSSVWAGLFASFAMASAGIVSALLVAALFLPSAPGAIMEWIALVEQLPLALGAHAVLWVAVASGIYCVESLERAGRATE